MCFSKKKKKKKSQTMYYFPLQVLLDLLCSYIQLQRLTLPRILLEKEKISAKKRSNNNLCKN